MLEKLKGLSQKYAEIEYMLSQSEVWADAQKAAALSREKAELTPLMEAYDRYESFRREAEDAETLLSDPEFAAHCTYVDVKGQFDSRYNMPQKTVPVNTRNNTITEVRGTDALHPNTSGYYQIGDAFYRAMVHVLNKMKS